MASKNKIHLESRFPAAKEAAYDTVINARDIALDIGEEIAHRKVEALNDSRGYNLPEDKIGQENIGYQSGRIYIGGGDEFWWWFFEYGTLHIPAYPMIRPAHRAMRKAFLARMDGLEGFVRRRPFKKKTIR